MKYRMYIDEVGNSDLKASLDPNHRYLSLTGVILELEEARLLYADWDSLRSQFFTDDPDERVHFHRRDLLSKRAPFESLRDPATQAAFDHALLRVVRERDYRVLTVVIDKREYVERHGAWAHHPYHVALEVLLEQFVGILRAYATRGDVMVESQGKRENRLLDSAFAALFTTGTRRVPAEELQQWVLSRKIKFRSKERNVAGLQLADLLAHPCLSAMRVDRARTPRPETFGSTIVGSLEAAKYHRSPKGKIEHSGRIWLP